MTRTGHSADALDAPSWETCLAANPIIQMNKFPAFSLAMVDVGVAP